MKNLAAFTSSDREYPAFISINKSDDGNSIEVAIRSKADLSGEFPVQGEMAEISLSGSDFIGLLEECILKLKESE